MENNAHSDSSSEGSNAALLIKCSDYAILITTFNTIILMLILEENFALQAGTEKKFNLSNFLKK